MDYKIIYSDRKSLSIQITKNCEIVVRAPKRIKNDVLLSFVQKHSGWIQEKLAAQKRRNDRYPEPSEGEYEELIKMAREILPARVEYYSALMGVSPSHISINRAKTRFGSCSDKGRINFSCRLMRYPAAAIDYVVVHELAHLKHLDHSRAFWAFVESVLPDYKERKRLLK